MDSVSNTMAAGAKYYLTKPPQVPYLLAVVRSAIEARREFDRVKESLNEALQWIGFLDAGAFSYQTVSEAGSLALTLAQASANPIRAWQGLNELLLNAVEHGNLGISYAEKSSLMLNGRLVEEIERRQQDQKYRSLRVSVHLARTPDGLELTIRDQGDGFDWKKYLEYSEERAFDLHGRGIAMATHCFDSIEYKGSGNTVKVTISELRPAS